MKKSHDSESDHLQLSHPVYLPYHSVYWITAPGVPEHRSPGDIELKDLSGGPIVYAYMRELM